jgi:hypothetical protein
MPPEGKTAINIFNLQEAVKAQFADDLKDVKSTKIQLYRANKYR